MAINPDDLSPNHLFDILDAVAVRRTRSFVKTYCPNDTVMHWSWAHIEGSSIPLLVLGFLVAYRNSLPKFLGVTAVVIVTSDMAEWLFAPSGSESARASGVIFGCFGYLIVRGFFNRNKVDIVVGVLIMMYYLPVFTALLPAPHLAYQDHIGGLVGGVFCGWAFRTHPAPMVTPSFSESPTSSERAGPGGSVPPRAY